jgi:hypothetical protein
MHPPYVSMCDAVVAWHRVLALAKRAAALRSPHLGGLDVRTKLILSATALVAAAVAAGTNSASAVDRYYAYAGPNTWGPSVGLKTHVGAVNYTVSYTALGNTSVVGEVSFYGPDGRPVTRQFNGSITFRTGNIISSPTVKFKGAPFGSAVNVTVAP